MQASASSSRRTLDYVQLDRLRDTPYAGVDPMSRFQQLHRQFVRQQRLRSASLDRCRVMRHTNLPVPPAAAIAEPVARKGGLESVGDSQGPRRPVRLIALPNTVATPVIDAELATRERVMFAEQRWRNTIHVSFENIKKRWPLASETVLRRTDAQRGVSSSMQHVILSEQSAREQCSNAEERMRQLVVMQHRRRVGFNSPSNSDGRGSPSPRRQKEIAILIEQEHSTRCQILRSEHEWLHHLMVSSAPITAAPRPPGGRGIDRLRRIESAERDVRQQIEIAERMTRACVVHGVIQALSSAAHSTAVSGATPSHQAMRRTIDSTEDAARTAILLAEGQWRRCIISNATDPHTIVDGTQVSLSLSLAATSKSEAEYRGFIESAEDVHRLLLLGTVYHRLSTTMPPRYVAAPTVAIPSPVPAPSVVDALRANEKRITQRVKGGQARDIKSELSTLVWDEESRRLQLEERERIWRQMHLETATRTESSVVAALQQKAILEAHQGRHVARLVHLYSLEEGKARALVENIEHTKWGYIVQLYTLVPRDVPPTDALATVVADELLHRSRIEFAEQRWRALAVQRYHS